MCRGRKNSAQPRREAIGSMRPPPGWQRGTIMLSNDQLTLNEVARPPGSPTSSKDVNLSDDSDADGESNDGYEGVYGHPDWHNRCGCWNRYHGEQTCGGDCVLPSEEWISKVARENA
ncbi:hypothetical protein AA313_de0206906 [Arthrobotrys entomopaga]|nr:hypothetical protein AA313_de0206906 [Arthrobotrys entomopaga]